MDLLINPDRERTKLALLMALLVNGRTVFEDFAWATGAERFAATLKEFGLEYEQQGHQLVVSGKGFQYSVPTLLPIGFPEYESVLLWTLASKSCDTVYTFAADGDEAGVASVNAAKALLQKYFKVNVQADEPARFAFCFDMAEPPIRKDSLGNVP